MAPICGNEEGEAAHPSMAGSTRSWLTDGREYNLHGLVFSSRAISDLIRCTALVPVPHSRAVVRMPLPLASAVRIAASFVVPILARPIGLPLLVPFSRALTSPAWIRSWMIARSNSANTPSIWKSARPAVLHLHAAMGMPVGLRGIGRVGRLSLPRRRLGAS